MVLVMVMGQEILHLTLLFNDMVVVLLLLRLAVAAVEQVSMLLEDKVELDVQ